MDGQNEMREGTRRKEEMEGVDELKNIFFKFLKMNSYTNELNFLSSSNYHRSFYLHIIQTYPVAAHEQSTEKNKI